MKNPGVAFIVSLSSTIRFTEFGGPTHERPVQDLAFAVARFIQKGGSFLNYYMVGFIIDQCYGFVLPREFYDGS